MIRNLPQKYRSKLNQIYLLLLCNSDDLKTKSTDMNDVLRPIVREMIHLEEIGLDVNTKKRLFGTIANMSYDNLGAHSTMGLIESFNSNCVCRMCTCDREETKHLCVEVESKIRNKQMYSDQLETVAMSERVNFVETQGVKRYCILNDLKYFNIFENLSVDIMHDLNEGCIPFLLKHLFKYCSKTKILSEEKLVQKFQFYDYGFLNNDQRPSVISCIKHNLNQNASQSKCLFEHVPFVLYAEQQHPELKQIWNCVETLLVIAQICYSLEIHENDLHVLNESIKVHLESIQKYFNVNLLPKHHFLTHYVRVIRTMGSLVPMSTKRYESKHKVLKEIARTTNNFKNITKTIANIHQQMATTNIDAFKDNFSFGLKTPVPNDFIESHKLLLSVHFNMESPLMEVKWIKYNNWGYRRGLFMFVNKVLFEIVRILFKQNSAVFLMKPFRIISFQKNLNAVKIKEKNPIHLKVVEFDQIEHKQAYEKKVLNEDLYIIVDTLETRRCMNIETE